MHAQNDKICISVKGVGVSVHIQVRRQPIIFQYHLCDVSDIRAGKILAMAQARVFIILLNSSFTSFPTAETPKRLGLGWNFDDMMNGTEYN